jgi:aldehyde dehydrogenase (NAD+)
MNNATRFYINGAWVEPLGTATLAVINPATEQPFATIAMGTAADAARAIGAARAAFPAFSQTTKAYRLGLLQKILALYNERAEEIAQVVSDEMGAPLQFARDAQVWAGRAHLEAAIEALKAFEFEEQRGNTRVIREAIGVVGLITPWNWPLNQIVTKVSPALAAGCTMVLKPSEIAPLDGIIFAEVVHAAGVPPGVFNLVNGDGPTVGQTLASHPDVDMVSFTGSTRAGIQVAKSAADTVKRVTQELGGKSANIILPDADLRSAVTQGVAACFSNSGQSCDAPTRMLVPRDNLDAALKIAREAAESHTVGDPRAEGIQLGPVVSEAQYNKIQKLIAAGIAEGAPIVSGGPGRPAGLAHGYYARPTVFGPVRPDMTIAREEIFGPVLAIITFDEVDEAIAIANRSQYGLVAGVWTRDVNKALTVASKIKSGQVYINTYGAGGGVELPFGGYKKSGYGREKGLESLASYTQVKNVCVRFS